MFVVSFFIYILSVVSESDTPVSTRIRDNKLITIYRSFEIDYVKVKVFELKEGPIENVYNSNKTFYLGRTDRNFVLNFLDIPDSLQQDRNKLLVKFEYSNLVASPVTSPFMNWVGYINLNDMSLESGSDFIKFPTDESFPVSGYTINTITNELGSALYIVGGYRYSKKDKIYSMSDSFYKYNFTTKKWTNITYSADGKLKPLIKHKSVVIDNRYLVILGGIRPINYHIKYSIYDFFASQFELNSLYNLTIFDALTNKWEYINIEADKFYSHATTIEFYGFLATAHKDKIYVLGGSTSENQSIMSIPNEYLGIFDFKSKTWYWTPIFNKDIDNYIYSLYKGDIQVLNDQLIICTAINEWQNHIPILVYDMASQRMKSTLKLTNSSNDVNSINDKNEAQNQSKTLPAYVIVLIAVSCTVLLSVLIYILYRKNKNKPRSKNDETNYSGPIREVWANPNIDSINDIFSWDKKKELNIKKNSSKSLKPNRLSFNTGSSYKSDLIEFNNTVK